MKQEEKNVSDFSADEYSLLMNSFGASVSKHLLDEHYTVVWANDRYYEMFGYTKEEYESLFHNQCDLFFKHNPKDWQDMVEYITEVFSTGATRYEYVCRMPHRSGKKLWIKLVGNLTGEIVNGCPISYSVMMDITEQMQLQVEQTITYNNFPGLIAKYKITESGIWFIDANTKYFQKLKRHSDFSLADLTPESGLGAIVPLWPDIRQGKPISFTISPPGVDGKPLYMRVTAECVDWEKEDPVYLLIYDDITQLTEQQELLQQTNIELERLAYEDPVTGGMNRMRFDMVAGEAIRRASAGSYALVWLNMQRFKLINDIAGNEMGDSVLRYVYEKISLYLQEGEFLARITADNYSLLIRNADDATIRNRIGEIVTEVNHFNQQRKNQYFLPFTAGIYRIDDPSLEITQIQDRAHVARKAIRKKETDSLYSLRFYSEADRKKLVIEKNIENKMHAALENHEFEIYLQPKFSLKDNRISGAEALVRWNDPKRGMIPPNEFISVFEKNGFIVELDRYMMESVCALLRSWIKRGLAPIPVSVNVSRIHFVMPDFIQSYADICKKYDVPTDLIEIEVTETTVFEDPDAFSKIVEQIHKYGFSCSMDDFGSGYSSLNVLKDIYVDTLKLDRAFFSSEQMDNPRECDVIAAAVNLAKSLQIKSVAEGVETSAQADFLRSIECDMIQGFVFSRPIPVDEFEKQLFGEAV
ncbi:EAL domain-containing protein [Christensenella timonensis]|uniref:sensor domain-containing protein n=1 Tax=Christensenella timonensis TaxID=1816678 RepID=UPI00082F889A|nr:EAL domain-containing protein [Christensenella timonensis]